MKKSLISILVVAPVALFAFSTGLPLKSTGGVDGGTDCSSCHNSFGPANSDKTGSLVIQTVSSTYSPGVKQTLKVTVQQPNAVKWGFQLTARSVNDPTVMAGTFTPSADVQVLCANGNLSPCGGSLEFASHTKDSITGGSAGSRTYEFEWTPPINEVGPVILYASGVSANGDGLPTGDRAYTTTTRLEAQGACTLSKRPSLRTVVDAGSFQPGLTPNGLATIYGLDFQVAGRTRTAGPGDIVGNSFPRQLACLAVEIGGQRAPITYVQTDQINIQIPSLTATGSTSVRVIANPDSSSQLISDVGTIQLQPVAPSFFTFNGTSVAARHQDYSIAADPAVVPGGTPVKPGEVVLLYATGFGPTTLAVQAGDILDPAKIAPVSAPVSITVGGTTLAPADVLYVGLVPGSISGLYQLNIRVPASTPDGNVSVGVVINGVTSPVNATIPVKR